MKLVNYQRTGSARSRYLFMVSVASPTHTVQTSSPYHIASHVSACLGYEVST